LYSYIPSDANVQGDRNESTLSIFLWQVNKSTSQVDVQVLNLKLDELELASLRGDLQEAALHVNFDTRMGRGAVNVTGPRFSGLQVRFHGLSFRGHVRTGLVCFKPSAALIYT